MNKYEIKYKFKDSQHLEVIADGFDSKDEAINYVIGNIPHLINCSGVKYIKVDTSKITFLNFDDYEMDTIYIEKY